MHKRSLNRRFKPSLNPDCTPPRRQSIPGRRWRGWACRGLGPLRRPPRQATTQRQRSASSPTPKPARSLNLPLPDPATMARSVEGRTGVLARLKR